MQAVPGPAVAAAVAAVAAAAAATTAADVAVVASSPSAAAAPKAFLQRNVRSERSDTSEKRPVARPGMP